MQTKFEQIMKKLEYIEKDLHEIKRQIDPDLILSNEEKEHIKVGNEEYKKGLTTRLV